MNFELANKTGSKIPDISWHKIKNQALGKKYDLSLVLIGEAAMKSLNRRFLKKNKTTTVLSFSFSEDRGEIFICPVYVRKQAENLDINFQYYIIKLYIHGLLHLKRFEHGKEMEEEEKEMLLKIKN